MIDWNGDVFLCPHDWHRRVKAGNLSIESVWNVWTSAFFKKFREKLFFGERSKSPCQGCNAEGTLHGQAHASAWASFYKIWSNCSNTCRFGMFLVSRHLCQFAFYKQVRFTISNITSFSTMLNGLDNCPTGFLDGAWETELAGFCQQFELYQKQIFNWSKVSLS